MKTNYQNASLPDMIFEHRNKSYGAYVLRTDYNSRISRAMLISFACIFFLGFGKFLSDRMKKDNRNTIDNIVVIEPVDEIHLKEEKIEILKPKPPVEEQPRAIQTERNTDIIVRQDNQIIDSVPTAEEMRNIDPGIHTNLNGNEIGVTDGKGNQASFTTTPEPPVASSEPLRFVEIMPVFPGGETALMKFLADNIVFPPMERKLALKERWFRSLPLMKMAGCRTLKSLEAPAVVSTAR